MKFVSKLFLIQIIFFSSCFIFAKSLEFSFQSLHGKYSHLIAKVKCKSRGSKLKEFTRFNYKDAGYFAGGIFCDDKKTPKGYYVFYIDTWYVWKDLNKNFNKLKTASIDGKYKKLIKKYKRPQDKKFYKEFIEYGYQPYGLRMGNWAPEGYYVYLYPDWYVFEEMKIPGKIPKAAYMNEKYVYVYSDLLYYFKCPADKNQYGEKYEYGWYDNISSPYCGVYSREGYWVYSYPNWYIWKSRRKVEDYRKEDKDAVWPPVD